MQVEVDVKCMRTNFGGCGLSGFGDLAPFLFAIEMAKISFGPWTIMVVKKLNWLKKIMQVEVDLKCMKTNFCGHGPSGFGDFAPFCLPSKLAEFLFQIIDYNPCVDI